jgi:hypothetical protein
MHIMPKLIGVPLACDADRQPARPQHAGHPSEPRFGGSQAEMALQSSSLRLNASMQSSSMSRAESKTCGKARILKKQTSLGPVLLRVFDLSRVFAELQNRASIADLRSIAVELMTKLAPGSALRLSCAR